jgi:hypothetical protein
MLPSMPLRQPLVLLRACQPGWESDGATACCSQHMLVDATHPLECRLLEADFQAALFRIWLGAQQGLSDDALLHVGLLDVAIRDRSWGRVVQSYGCAIAWICLLGHWMCVCGLGIGVGVCCVGFGVCCLGCGACSHQGNSSQRSGTIAHTVSMRLDVVI